MIEVRIKPCAEINVAVLPCKKVEVSTFGSVRYYGGDYTVTPAVYPQTVSTKGLCMVKNLTVRAIPYYEEENSAGGITVRIG